MRKLSFQTFLRRTLKALSYNGYTAPHQLAKELPANPRLLQPLCLYVSLIYDEQQKLNLFRRFPVVEQEFSKRPLLDLSSPDSEYLLDTMQDAEDSYHMLKPTSAMAKEDMTTAQRFMMNIMERIARN